MVTNRISDDHRRRRLKVIVWILASLLTAVAGLQILVFVAAQSTTPPPIPQIDSMTVTVEPKYIFVGGVNATITATVYYENGDPAKNARVFFNNSETNLGTLSGGYYTWISDWGRYEWNNFTNEEGVATIILTSGTAEGTERIRVWVAGHEGDPKLDKTVTVEITAVDEAPPSVTNPEANPGVILNDNGRGRAAGTNVSRINVTVTDDAGVANVAIDLSPIGGSATQPMERIEGTDIWTVRTNASSGINVTNYLLVNATDIYSKSNDTVSVPLEVLRRGDVKRDNAVNMEDMIYIARYTVGLEPEASNPPSVLVGDVVGAGGDPRGDGKVDMKDALYIARWVAGLEQEP